MASRQPPKRSLRLLRGGRAPDPDAASRAVCSYTNRFGVRYYLHVTRTRNGQTRYVPRKSISKGALSAMPAGHDFDESLGGVVSVRRVRRPGRVPIADFELVVAAVDRHRRLREHVVQRCQDRITIHEPDPEPEAWWDIDGAQSEYRRYVPANKPHVRAALTFVVVGEWATGGPRLYQARGPLDPTDLRWTCLGEGLLGDLVARFVDDRETSPLLRE